MSIDYDPTITDTDENQSETIPQTAKLAIKALSIASKFRDEYKLESRKLNFTEWDIKDYLDKASKRS